MNEWMNEWIEWVSETRMALTRAHTSAKAADPTELSLLNKCQLKHTPIAVYRLAAMHLTVTVIKAIKYSKALP